MKAGSHAVVPPHGHDCAVCGAQLDRAHLESDPDGDRCAFCGAPQTQETARPDLRLLPGDGTGGDDDLGSLRSARVARGETLEQAAHFTNIRLSYLRRLEGGDVSSFDPYPGRVYARFFVRDYADHLGVDPEPLLHRFDRETAPALELLPAPIRQRTVRRRRWAIGALILLVVLVAADARLRQASDRPDVPPPAAGRHLSAPGDRTGSPRPASAPTPGVAVVLHTTARCWVDASVDGHQALQRTVPAGKTVDLRGVRVVDLRLGNAGAVTLEVNGRPVSTGAPGEVVDLRFALRDGRLVRP